MFYFLLFFFESPRPSFQRGLHFLPKPLFNGLYTPFGSPVSGGQKPQGTGDVTAPPRRSEPLRSKDGGPSKVSPDCAGWDRLSIEGDNSVGSTSVSSSASTALVVVQRELKYLGLWKFAGAVMYVLHEALGLSGEKMIAPMDEKRGKLLLAEILNGGNFWTALHQVWTFEE